MTSVVKWLLEHWTSWTALWLGIFVAGGFFGDSSLSAEELVGPALGVPGSRMPASPPGQRLPAVYGPSVEGPAGDNADLADVFGRYPSTARAPHRTPDDPELDLDADPMADAPAEDPSDGASVELAQADVEPPADEGGVAEEEPSLAPGMVKLLQDEIVDGLRSRRIADSFSRFCRYAGMKLDTSARPYTGSELAGNCRLRWYDHMLRNPLSAPAQAEHFTRELHKALCGNHETLLAALAVAAEKLDLPKSNPRRDEPVTSPEEALAQIERSLIEAQMAYAQALAPLSKKEIAEMQRSLYPILTSLNDVGHTLQNRPAGRRLCDLIEKKLDRRAMHTALEALAPLSSPELLAQLGELAEDDDTPAFSAVSGPVAKRVNTPGGAILIGGKGANTYQLDKMADVSVVIDLGGDDVYYEGSTSLHRPVLVVIDLGGNDNYRGTNPGIQGSGILGVSMLLDLDGNDTYQAKDVAQGSCLAGMGLLIDYAGNDTYHGLRRVQGVAIGGVAMLIDRSGNDRYHAAMWAQGVGGPLGFGVLEDTDGSDHYYGGGLYPNSYLKEDNPTPGYEGWCQGMGGGIRQVANGGIGVILDGGGDDVYEFDYLSHGGGYWCGLGFARDFGGNDQRLGATRKAYNGGPRTQRSYQRFGCGFGCHYALGFLFDDQGNDSYNGTIMCLGFAWDCAVGYLFDFDGNDAYSGTQGNGAQAGLGVLYDYDGDDTYRGYKMGRASSGISYHDLPYCGGNFSFVVDHGGEDQYGCRARNNSYNQRGSSGGFLIDRPKETEADQAAKPAARTALAGQ